MDHISANRSQRLHAVPDARQAHAGVANPGPMPHIQAMGVMAKICGLKTPETVDAAVSGGARFVGFRDNGDQMLANYISHTVTG